MVPTRAASSREAMWRLQDLLVGLCSFHSAARRFLPGFSLWEVPELVEFTCFLHGWRFQGTMLRVAKDRNACEFCWSVGLDLSGRP